MIILKQVLMAGVTMMKITEDNVLPSKCNKKEATNQRAMKINDDDICDIIEEVYRRDKFEKSLALDWYLNVKKTEAIVKVKKKVVAKIQIKFYWCLLLYYITMIKKSSTFFNIFLNIDYYNTSLLLFHYTKTNTKQHKRGILSLSFHQFELHQQYPYVICTVHLYSIVLHVHAQLHQTYIIASSSLH